MGKISTHVQMKHIFRVCFSDSDDRSIDLGQFAVGRDLCLHFSHRNESKLDG